MRLDGFKRNRRGYEHRSIENRGDSNGKIAKGIRFQDVCSNTHSHRTLRDFNVVVLRKENDPTAGGNPLDSRRGFEAVQNGHSDIEQRDIGLIFHSLLHRIFSVVRLTNDAPFRSVVKNCSDNTSPLTEIIGYENPNLMR